MALDFSFSLGQRELGGQGCDYLSLGIAIEEPAVADISCALIAWQHATHSHFFPGWGDDTVRAVHAAATSPWRQPAKRYFADSPQ